MGEVTKAQYHGKGLFYKFKDDTWELNEYREGKIVKQIKAGEGRPQSLEISKEVVNDDPNFLEIYIKPRDLFFDHYEVNLINFMFEGRHN